jgi:acetyl-CoA carboxylase biotin carboxyl carrier protein
MHQLRELIEIIEEFGVAELEITDNDEAIHIGRARAGQHTPSSLAAAPNAPGTTGLVEAGDDARDSYIVRSPMVGTFYRASAPDADPFIEVGDTVKDDDTLCIISALKIQNRIKTEGAGRVSAILVENAQPVEYDQALFVISRRQDTHQDTIAH